MFEALVDYLAALTDGDLHSVSVEDVALCVCWRAAASRAGADAARCGEAEQLEKRWRQHFTAVRVESEGARQQPLLRALIDEVQEHGATRLQPEELEYLVQVTLLMEAAPHTAYFARPLSRLRPHLEKIERRREQTPLDDPALPSLSERLQYVTEEQLLRAPRRDITFFAGVRLPFRGPVFMAKKALKVLGSVPEECAIAVEGAPCYITGHALGCVTVTSDCDVLGNVSGAVISSTGDIRLCDIINKALLIAKRGSVRCRSGYDPKLAFANTGIEVQQNARRGVYIAPIIRVKRQVSGGVFHVTHEMTAAHLGQDDHTGLDLIFRRMLTCEDYGEALSQEAYRMLARSKVLRQRTQEYQQMAVLANAEADRLAGNALLYLCGGEQAASRLQELETMQRRLAFLDRVISGTEGLIRISENRLLMADDATGTVEEEVFDLDAVQEEMHVIETEGAIDSDLARGRDEIETLHKQISRGRGNPVNAEMLSKLYDKNAEWLRERAKLAATLEKKQVEVTDAVGRVAILERVGADASRLKILQQLLDAARSTGQGDLITRRSAQTFMQMLMRRLQLRLQRVQRYQKQVTRMHEDYRTIAERLRKEHRISVPEMAEGEFKYARAVVKGAFAAGVNIYGDLHFYKAGVKPGIGRAITEDTADQAVTWVRGSRGTVERES
ncbi:MAG: hypothetical protein IT368_00775 [Candidatus Hydrogenedentes bacterium]|nr:hypothetical protein [Candidatus Hydrogenedentota bacterium]